MPFDSKILDILACPKCKARLELKSDESALLCPACKLGYPIVEGIPNLITDDAQPFAD